MMTLPGCLAVSMLLTSFQSGLVTLETVLRKHDVQAAALPDANRPITSYEVMNDAEWFAIGYYWDEHPNQLPDIVRVRTYDKRAGRWQYAEFPSIGSVLRLHRGASWWYVSGHSSPSAAPTLVLTHDLRILDTLKGWPELVLPDGRVVYQHNMVHFAPAHPGSLGLYDPATRQDVRLFPAKPDPIRRGGPLLDRAIGDVRVGRTPNTVVFPVVEQDVRITPTTPGERIGTPRKLSVTCSLARQPRCAVR